MTLVFWCALVFVTYVYLGYPAILALWAKLRPRPLLIAGEVRDPPRVSIILAVRNEGWRLPARIDNLLTLDYPADRRQIVVVSDGSTDETLAILDRYRSSIDIVAVEACGKALALNLGVACARHPLLVFADARQSFAPDALIELSAPFQDARVGAVSGELLLDGESGRRRAVSDRRRGPSGSGAYEASAGSFDVTSEPGGQSSPLVMDRRRIERRNPSPSPIAEGVGLYWRLEKWMRQRESEIASTLGTTGAIYAMRRELWRPLPADTILDDVLEPMWCVLAGYRVVFNHRARAFDRPAPDAETETRRKIRTLAGNYQALWLEPRLMLPWRNAVWFQYVSHKVGRLLVPYALIALMFANIALAGSSIFYATALAGHCGVYVLAGYGAWLNYKESPGAARANAGLAAAATARRSQDSRALPTTNG